MKTLAHILYYKILIFIKFNSSFKVSTIIKNVSSALVYLLFAYGCFLFTQSSIGYLLNEVKIGSFLLHRFALVLLFIFFTAVNVGNIVVSFSTIYKSQEVFFLITKPISFTKLFLIKFLDNFFYSSTTLLLIIISVLLGYGAYFKLGFWFYPFSIIFLMIPFLFIAASLGVIILLCVLKFSSKFGIKKTLISLVLLYFLAIISFYLISNPIHLIDQVFEYPSRIDSYFGYLENDLIIFLPNYWISESLYWVSNHNIERAVPFIYINILASIAIFGFALFLAKIWFYETWITSLKINSEFKLKKNHNNPFFSFENRSWMKSLDESVVKREFWLFFREPNQWLHLLVMLFLITIFVSSIGSIDVIMFETFNTQLKTLVFLIISTFNVFLIASLSLRFVFPIISLEGEALWKIKSSPVNPNHIIFKRLAIYFLAIFFIGQLISFFSNYQLPTQLAVVSHINSALSSITLISLNFGMGGLFANYKEKNAIRLSSSQGASITFLFTLVYLVIIVMILFIPVSDFFYYYSLGYNYSLINLLITSLILLAIAIIVWIVSLKVAYRSFNKDY